MASLRKGLLILGESLLIVVTTVPLFFEINILSNDVTNLFTKHGASRRKLAYSLGACAQFLCLIFWLIYRYKAWQKEKQNEEQLKSIETTLNQIGGKIDIIVGAVTPSGPADVPAGDTQTA